MRMRNIGILLTVSLINFGCVTTQQVYYAAPSELSATQRQMKTPGFWIARHPSPDLIIMNAQEIIQFNRHVQNDLKLTKDLLDLPAEFSGDELVKEWNDAINKFKIQSLYAANGRHPEGAFWDEVRTKMTKVQMPEKVTPAYGFIVHYADQRLLPTREGLYAKPGDIDFDELQNSTLDVGTPVAVLSSRSDGQWYYVEAPLSAGWVEKDKITLTDRGKVEDDLNDKDFVVVTKAKADIFLNQEMTEYYDYARMGSKFRIGEGTYDNGTVSVWVPTQAQDGLLIFKEGFMKQDDVHQGYLSYTPRTMIEQAFELLNEPYGWGGMYGEQDCSAFLDEIFSTAGIVLPRNSADQRKSGVVLAQFNDETDQEKLAMLKKAVGGVTLLGMKGHILLYLGVVNDRPYAIHSVWAYREPGGKVDRIRVINRVAVSDLFLGEGSKNGSLLKRLKEVVFVSNVKS